MGKTVKENVFYLALASLLTHELDAVANHEWRILPLLKALPETLGMSLFIGLHVPLFALLLALVASDRPAVRQLSRFGVCIFLILHAGLHAAFIGQPGYEFSSAVSHLLIFGGSLVGGLYLTWVARERTLEQAR